MNQSKSGFLPWLAVVVFILGFFTAVMGMLNDMEKWVATSAGVQNLVIAGFVFFVLAALYIAFGSSAAQGIRWGSLGVLLAVTGLFCFWLGSQRGGNAPVQYDSVNLVKAFRFEDQVPADLTLGVCDNTPTWYDICHDAPSRLSLAGQGFTGLQSLEVRIERVPQKDQVYSLRLPVSPAVFADSVNAKVYISNPSVFSKITLAARIKGENTWVFSDMLPAAPGWLHFLVDLQDYKPGSPPTDVAVDEIHIDIFANKATSSAQEATLLVDDIELYYPIVKSYKTGE